MIGLAIQNIPLFRGKGAAPVQPSTYHQIVLDWVDRVVANGGSEPSSSTKSALDTFVRGLETVGLLNKMLVVNPLVPDNLIAAMTPLIADAGNSLWTANNYQAGDLSANGLAGDGSSKYAATGIDPQNLTHSNFGMSIWTSSANSTGYGVELGAYISSVGPMLQQRKTATNTTDIWLPELLSRPIRNAGYLYGGRYDVDGLVCVAGLDGSHFVDYEGTDVFSDSFSNGQIMLHVAGNDGGNPVSSTYSNAVIGFAALHQFLTAQQSAALCELVFQLREDLGWSPADSGTLNEAGDVVVNEEGNPVV